MLYHSLNYKNFLSSVLGDAEPLYLLGKQDGEIQAVLPLFARQGPYGTVLNSLPFFGSHGSLLSLPGCSLPLRDLVWQSFLGMQREPRIASSTLIETPSIPLSNPEQLLPPTFVTEKWSQITPLPFSVPPELVAHNLLYACHGKTRNMIKKAMRASFQIDVSSSDESLWRLQNLHESNMVSKGRTFKALEVFSSIKQSFEQDQVGVYEARSSDGTLAASLLLIYYDDWVEYFVPAVNPAYRSHQPLTALIFRAMQDSVIERGAKYWNWGGTPDSQPSLFRFKARWGSLNTRYRTLTWSGSSYDKLTNASIKDLIVHYRYFYSRPW